MRSSKWWSTSRPWGLCGLESERNPIRKEAQPRQRDRVERKSSGLAGGVKNGSGASVAEARPCVGPTTAPPHPEPGDATEPLAAWTPALATSPLFTEVRSRAGEGIAGALSSQPPFQFLSPGAYLKCKVIPKQLET